MFDLNNIDFIRTDQQRNYRNYSFVGIQRNKDTERLEFWLPLGFDDFGNTDFELVKDFFFKMYRTFNIYLQKKQNNMESKDITIDRDGIIENENGFSFINENNEQVIFYGKLNSLNKIIEGYDELRISSLEKKQIKSHNIDYSKIHLYMHQAIYLDDDVIYIDEMNIAKNILIKESPPILQIFCFIYTEIKKELEELEHIPNKAIELAEQFKENYLQPNSSLFGEDTFAETVNILRETLEDIDTKTTYKDQEYWHFFEAVEAFLYGERQEDNQGIYWGFSSFYDIWEDMCQTYILNSPDYNTKIIFADINGRLENYRNNYPINPFELKLNNLQQVRYLRPDLVLEEKDNGIEKFFEISRIDKQGQSFIRVKSLTPSTLIYLRKNYTTIYNKYLELSKPDDNSGVNFYRYMSDEQLESFKKFIEQNCNFSSSYIKIVDYKYMRVSDYENYLPNYIDKDGENKVKDDIQKQLIYEWSVQQNWDKKTESEFWIPYYFLEPLKKEQLKFYDIHIVNNESFNQSKIKIVKINFKILQDFYIKQASV